MIRPSVAIIKYKEHAFNVRPDALGCSETLQQMMSEYNFQQYILTKPYLEEPEFIEVQDIIGDMSIIIEDQVRCTAKLQTADADNKKVLNHAIKESKRKLAETTKRLTVPRLAKMYQLIQSERILYEMSFKQKPENVRALAEAYLEPPASNGTAHTIDEFIDFKTKDDDYFKLAEDLFAQFFFTVQQISVASMRL